LDFGLRVAQLLNRMEIKLGEIETAGGYKLQNIRIYSFDGSLIATIDVKLFDEASGRLGPALELTVDPQKRILLSPLNALSSAEGCSGVRVNPTKPSVNSNVNSTRLQT
jgi:hypothetical protein